MHLRFNLFTHIIILVVERKFHHTFTVLGIKLRNEVGHLLLTRFKLLAVVVANDKGGAGLFYTAFHSEEVEETFVFRSCFGSFVGRKCANELCRHASGVDHLVFRVSGVHTDACKFKLRSSGVEVLKLNFAKFATVHRVSPFATKLLDIKFVGTETNFFVRVKTYANLTMFDFGMLYEIHHCLNNFGNTRFVVSTKQSVSVGNDNVFALVLEQFGELLNRSYNTRFGIEHNVCAVIILHNAGLDILTRAVGTRVHVGNKPNGRHGFIGIGGKGGVKITEFVEFHVFHADGNKFFLKIFRKDKLLGGAGRNARSVVRLRVETNILQKTFYNSHCLFLLCKLNDRRNWSALCSANIRNFQKISSSTRVISAKKCFQ